MEFRGRLAIGLRGYDEIRVAALSRVAADNGGRVEAGREHWRRSAAPFSSPAHQTGRADFRHPAFRLASPQTHERGFNWTS
jgi:hypothetical protein